MARIIQTLTLTTFGHPTKVRPREGPMAPVTLPCQPQPLALSPSWGLRRGGIQYLFDMATAFL